MAVFVAISLRILWKNKANPLFIATSIKAYLNVSVPSKLAIIPLYFSLLILGALQSTPTSPPFLNYSPLIGQIYGITVVLLISLLEFVGYSVGLYLFSPGFKERWTYIWSEKKDQVNYIILREIGGVLKQFQSFPKLGESRYSFLLEELYKNLSKILKKRFLKLQIDMLNQIFSDILLSMNLGTDIEKADVKDFFISIEKSPQFHQTDFSKFPILIFEELEKLTTKLGKIDQRRQLASIEGNWNKHWYDRLERHTGIISLILIFIGIIGPVAAYYITNYLSSL